MPTEFAPAKRSWRREFIFYRPYFLTRAAACLAAIMVAQSTRLVDAGCRLLGQLHFDFDYLCAAGRSATYRISP